MISSVCYPVGFDATVFEIANEASVSDVNVQTSLAANGGVETDDDVCEGACAIETYTAPDPSNNQNNLSAPLQSIDHVNFVANFGETAPYYSTSEVEDFVAFMNSLREDIPHKGDNQPFKAIVITRKGNCKSSV